VFGLISSARAKLSIVRKHKKVSNLLYIWGGDEKRLLQKNQVRMIGDCTLWQLFIVLPIMRVEATSRICSNGQFYKDTITKWQKTVNQLR